MFGWCHVGLHVKEDKIMHKMDTSHSFRNGVTPAPILYLWGCNLHDVRKTQIKTKQVSTWKRKNNSKSKYGNSGQKSPKLGIFLSAILCHKKCHTGTGTSHDVLKSETRARRTHTQVLRALDWSKRSSGGQDMSICPNVKLMRHRGRRWLTVLVTNTN